MKTQKGLLSNGLFNKSFMDSKAKTRAVSTKEWVLGHLIGPLGLIFVVKTIAALVEKYFTQQVGLMYGQGNLEMVEAMGGKYELVMTIAKILAVGIGLLNGFLVQRTKSRQGRLRPWYLIFGFVSIAIGGLIFLFAGENGMGDNYWIYFFVLLVCYHTVGSTFFYLFRDTIVSLISRDPAEKLHLKFVRQLCWTLISGILIGMLVTMVVLPHWLDKDISGYPILMIILSIVAIPLLLMEYFYTRERVTEAYAEEVGIEKENKIPLKEQLKAIFKNKYLVILFALMTLQGISDNFKGGNVQYFYIKFMLGGDTDPNMFLMFQVITGIPLGIGAFLIYPISKKFGVKNVTFVGYILVLAGSIIAWIFPDNVMLAMIVGFFRQVGYLPHAYIFATLLVYAYDDAEFRSHIRLEGLMGVAIIVAIQQLLYAPVAGGYEAQLLRLRFVDAESVAATAEQKAFMTGAFFLPDIIVAATSLLLLPLVNVEKKLSEIKAELIDRQKIATLARGEEWIEPDELDRIEKEEAAKVTEENRVADLKDHCAQKGLDFDTENNKYLVKKAEKEAKWAEKRTKKEARKNKDK